VNLILQLRHTVRVDGRVVLDNLAIAALAGAVAAGLALAAAWLARGSVVYRVAILAGAAVAVAVPGPVLGFGLKKLIQCLIATVPSEALAQLLWYGPSSVPLGWVDVIRYFPVALALVWPVVRAWPEEWFTAARLDGVTATGEWRGLVWPAGRRLWARAALA